MVHLGLTSFSKGAQPAKEAATLIGLVTICAIEEQATEQKCR